MEEKAKELTCFVGVTNGVSKLFVRKIDGEFDACWENDDLRDDITTMDEFIEEYGDYYFDSMDDFKDDISKSFKEYFNE